MKKMLISLLAALLLCGCASNPAPAQVAATTLPVYDFTRRLCDGTSVTVTRLVTEPVSCLHDYALNVRQVQAAEAAEVIVISGAGLEAFMADLLTGRTVIDASEGVELLCGEEEHAQEDHHHHEEDPHIWLSPENAKTMAKNIQDGLSRQFPEYSRQFEENCGKLLEDLDRLERYGQESLSDLRCRELITFHDGFHYFADAFDLTILEAVEEESGSEASARELIHLTVLTREHHLPAVFTERNGSVSAAEILSRETGCAVRQLDMAMASEGYFEAMYHNIDTVKEALE